MLKLLVATRNQGKILELIALLKDFPFEIKTLDDFDETEDVEETGKTFLENANLKSLDYARQTGCLTLADDSGLEVDALNGAPGVFSARYSGINASDKDNINKLLHALREIKKPERSARFVCAMSVSEPRGTRFTNEGFCDGEIALNSMGSNGFGYDPVFIPSGFEQTFGELPAETKKKLSHRSNALKKIIGFLSKIDSC